jgi:hypothetical protein
MGSWLLEELPCKDDQRRLGACARGVRCLPLVAKMGRRPKLTVHQRREAIRRQRNACRDWVIRQRERLDDFTAPGNVAKDNHMSGTE